jgi:hypothetical protein
MAGTRAVGDVVATAGTVVRVLGDLEVLDLGIACHAVQTEGTLRALVRFPVGRRLAEGHRGNPARRSRFSSS